MSVNGYAFPEIDEVGRRVSPHFEALGPQERFAGGNDASLAVRASDVNSGKFLVGRTELGEEGFCALETWFDAACGACEESLYRFAVRRQEVVHPADAGLPLM